MCGIAGILRTYPAGTQVPPREESIREEWLDILDESIKHRGPDGAGRFRDRVVRADGTTVDVALIHRRMAIIDLAGGHQPMLLKPDEPDAPDQVVVVFNGCIYNHRELRKELEAEGARFRTNHSDTEVLLWGWKNWGAEWIERLEGMFAYALWDRQTGTLEVLREEYREKPLWTVSRLLAHGDHDEHREQTHMRFDVFASVAAGVLRVHAATRDFDSLRVDPHQRSWGELPEGFRDWLALGSSALVGAAVHSGHRVRKAQPFQIIDNHIHTRRYLQLTTDEVDQALESAVQARMVADRPLGCFLSGGVDSSLISLYAKRHMPEIQTFCLRMPDQRFDESRIAASVASQIGARHTTLEVSTDVAADLVRIIEEIGAPFGDSSLLPTMWLCREAKKHVTVALAGDGGDELFAGYERHLAAPALDYWWWLFRLLPRSLIEGSGAKSPLSKLNRLCVASDDILFQRQACMLLRRSWSNPQLKRLFVPNGDGRPGYAMGTGIYPERATRRFLWQRLMRAWKDPHAAWTASVSDALDHDIDDYLPNDILFKTDSASMHSALEVRAPFLDSKVAALARSATIDSLMPNGQRKGLLRALARKYLPASIVDRPKMGFAIPLADWFRSDFGSLRTLLGDLVINAQDPFPADILGCELNRSFIRELFDQHMSGKRDHAQRLYALLVMAIWCRWYRRVSRTTDVLAR